MAFSLPVMLHNLLNISRNQVEIYLLAMLISAGASGVFNVAARTSLLVVAFLDGLGIVFSPFIAELVNRPQNRELRDLMSIVTRWSVSLGLPVSLALVVFSRPIVQLFGSGFIDAVPALVILAIAQLINAATGPVGTFITMSGRPGLNLINSLLSVVLSLSLGLILIPRYGITGAALSSGISITSVNLLRAIQVHSALRIWYYDWRLLKPVVGAGIAVCITSIVLWLAHSESDLVTLGVGMPIFFLVYLGSLFFFGLEESDLAVLKNVRGRALRDKTKVS
jgi:O-antigen/teichoic acid export membrane protein